LLFSIADMWANLTSPIPYRAKQLALGGRCNYPKC